MIDRNSVASEKLAKAEQLMKERNIDLWIFFSRQNRDPSFELMFNFNPAEECLVAIESNGKRVMISSEKQINDIRPVGLFTEYHVCGSGNAADKLAETFDFSSIHTIALNMSADDDRCDGLTQGLYNKLEKALGKIFREKTFVSSYPILEYLRAVKSASEIEIMRACSVITTDIYDVVFSKIAIGMSETEVGDIFMEELAKRNAVQAIGDPKEYPLVLLVKHGMSHRRPSPFNYIEAGDMLVMDFSARYCGYTSDIARTVYFLKKGEEHAPADVKHCVDSAIKAVGAVMAQIKPGMHGYEADAIGRQSIVDSGYPTVRHSVGHLVGLEVHDGGTRLGPDRKNKSCQGIIRENEIYALEPTVLQDGGLPCAIVEDNVLITKTGCVLISKRQTSIIEIPYRVKEAR
ncbi:MAG: Xaa-Pro peptidase family protein [Candidatus Cloacimonetes bacterium]|nr:Xaa-Pro peptidase family protein [Candidatus Cloacimonadota bacterium]